MLSPVRRSSLERLLEVLRRRHQLTRFDRIKPNRHQRQMSEAMDSHVVSLLCGANGIGKTAWIVFDALSRIVGRAPWDPDLPRKVPPISVVIVGPDFTNYHPKKTIPIILSLMPRENWREIRKNNNGVPCEFVHHNGSVLTLMSYEQHLRKPPEQASPFEGIDFDYYYLDEPPPKAVFVACQRGAMKRQGHMGMALTPIAEWWIWNELYEPAEEDDDIFAITVDIYSSVKSADNPDGHLDPHWVQAFLNTVKGSDDEEARIHGRFKHLMGRIFKNYDQVVHRFDPGFIKIDPSWPKGLTIDPHDRRPFFMAWWAVNPDNQVLFFAEWPTDPFHEYRSYDNKWRNYGDHITEFEREIPGGSRSVRWRIMDPNAGTQVKGATGETLPSYLARKHGLFFRVDVDDSLARGHQKIRIALEYDKEKGLSATNKPSILISNECWNLDWALRNYQWNEHRDQKKVPSEGVKEDAKDPIDVIRYTLMYEPRFRKAEDIRPRRVAAGQRSAALGARYAG